MIKFIEVVCLVAVNMNVVTFSSKKVTCSYIHVYYLVYVLLISSYLLARDSCDPIPTLYVGTVLM
jgi:hypothetical protein